MPAPLNNDLQRLDSLLDSTKAYASHYLQTLDTRPVGVPIPSEIPAPKLTDQGIGALAVLEQFREHYDKWLSASPGSRYLGFVTGGTTPAGLMADWLVSTFDQNAQWSGDTVAPHIEQQALNWLRDMLGLPSTFTGLCVTGATMANFTGLAIGRQWLGEQRGVDIAAEGLQAMPAIHVLSGAAHSSVLKALSMLGVGHRAVEKIPCLEGTETVDINALSKRLAELDGAPVIVVGNAGVVNNGEFDDLAAIAALKQRHAFWFHIDGAFGLLAGLSPRYAHLIRGAELADSITVDGHKWLNVPYDAGYVYTRHIEMQIKVFQNISSYLGAPVTTPLNTLHLGPENSRRWRALPLWFTLMAYGKQGMAAIVEQNCEMAKTFAEVVSQTKGLRLAAPVNLNICCFTLDGITDMTAIKQLQKQLAETGELMVTPSMYLGTPILRAAFSNWRTNLNDIDRIKCALKSVTQLS